MRTATIAGNPPYACMTWTTQYKVIEKARIPVPTPSRNTRCAEAVGRVASIATATMRGARATQPNAGEPNLGKLNPSNTPESRARAVSTA